MFFSTTLPESTRFLGVIKICISKRFAIVSYPHDSNIFLNGIVEPLDERKKVMG